MKNSISILTAFLLSLMIGLSVVSCVDKDFDEPPSDLNLPDINSNTTIAQLKEKHVLGEFEKIEDDLIIEGVVVADDESGNYYKTLVIQDQTGGINVVIDVTDLYTDYPVGRRIFIKAKDLWLGDNNGLIQLGAGITTNSSGREVVAFIAEAMMPDHIFKGENNQTVTPKVVTIDELSTDVQDPNISTLIQINDIQFATSDVGLPYATGGANPFNENRNMVDCDGNTIILRNSGYSSFVNELMPDGKGSIIAIYSVFGDDKQILIRDLDDVMISGDRCGSGPVTGELMTIKEVRALFSGTTTNAPAGKKIKGVVISDRANGNTTSKNIVVQDASGAGIVIRFTDNHSFALGDEIEVNISGVELSEFNGLLQLNNMPLSNASKQGTGSITPNTITIEEILTDFENLESTLVTIEDATISGGNIYNGDDLILNDGTASIILFTAVGASFAGTAVATGTVKITGIVSQFNVPQIIIRNLSDVSGGGIGPMGGEIDESFSGQVNDQDIVISGWKNIAVKGTRLWRGKEFDSEKYAQATAYGDTAPAMETWLITPGFDLSEYNILSFESAKAFWVHDGLSVYISTDFDGSNVASATWNELSSAIIAEDSDPDHTFIPSGDVDLSSYSGIGYIGFKYVGNGATNTSTYRIDNVKVRKP